MTSDRTERPQLWGQRPRKLTVSLRLTIQVSVLSKKVKPKARLTPMGHAYWGMQLLWVINASVVWTRHTYLDFALGRMWSDVECAAMRPRCTHSMVKVASWWRHSWPPRASQPASEGLRRPFALVRRGPAPQIPVEGCDLPAKGRPSCHFHCI